MSAIMMVSRVPAHPVSLRSSFSALAYPNSPARQGNRETLHPKAPPQNLPPHTVARTDGCGGCARIWNLPRVSAAWLPWLLLPWSEHSAHELRNAPRADPSAAPWRPQAFCDNTPAVRQNGDSAREISGERGWQARFAAWPCVTRRADIRGIQPTRGIPPAHTGCSVRSMHRFLRQAGQRGSNPVS
jgi:hypothetical protein